jgi:hypothetical protein
VRRSSTFVALLVTGVAFGFASLAEARSLDCTDDGTFSVLLALTAALMVVAASRVAGARWWMSLLFGLVGWLAIWFPEAVSAFGQCTAG